MWLVESEALSSMRRAEESSLKITEDQNKMFSDRFETDGRTEPRILSKNGADATIDISGVMTEKPDFLAMIFGGGNTTYSEIITSLDSAENDDNIDNITLNIDSPGGNAVGLLGAMDAINSTKKPIKALVKGMAASAAYVLATQADKVVAENEMSMVGSFGVVTERFIDKRIVSITNSESPDKRPDVTTDAGKDVVVAQLDSIYGVMASRVAEGRGVSVDKINSDFGKGAMFVANDAIDRGMIDSRVQKLVQSTPSLKNAPEKGQLLNDKGISMDLNKLKAEHSELYLSVVKEGVDSERNRAKFHATMGEKTGCYDVALSAIKDGSAVDDGDIMATYLTANLNKNDLNAVADDATDVANVKAAEKKEDDAKRAGNNIMAGAFENLGIKLEK